ncbi:hypothetical protein AB733_19200 [Photobacterium swingsii]|uniref:DUF2541 domain-containing protein n=1 Tax=Photobacterium swingsii TaxID=680026 RepID=A0A0J8V9D2_9GAMM|nr:hypothetical protein [Photobacterium swingsii]KMV29230.1 hypothetical protein AB733_19200 [Photobacterium swingsii]PSW23175.1 hypothetical protein C9I94_16245 [Photobacterium swingsii]
MRKLIIGTVLAAFLSPSAIATQAERKTTLVIDVAGSIYVRKPSLSVVFEKYKPTLMKADMSWEIYWTLNHPLNIDYTCWNHDPNVDMCSRIKMEIDSLDSSKKLELSTANPSITISERTRFYGKKWNNTAYLDLNGLDGGEVRATGRLVLSAKI